MSARSEPGREAGTMVEPPQSGLRHGVLAWVTLMTPEREPMVDFYGQVFGWVPRVTAEFDSYTEFLLEGRRVAGIGYPPPTRSGIDIAHEWVPYFTVNDIEVAAAAVEENGGALVVDPMELGDYGWGGVAADVDGTLFGLWKPFRWHGAAVTHEPNSWCWNELLTGGVARSAEFYGRILGVQAVPAERGGFVDMTLVTGPARVAGIAQPAGPYAAAGLNGWVTHFAVADTRESAAGAIRAGATLVSGPFDTPWGVVAVFLDPLGAVFALVDIDPEYGIAAMQSRRREV